MPGPVAEPPHAIRVPSGVADQIEYEYFDHHPPDTDMVATELAACYQQVYGTDDAWNEGRVCRSCSTPSAPAKWNYRGAPDACVACGSNLDHFWPIDQILADMRTELNMPDAVCAVARHDGKIIGGCWGFSASPAEMEDHLNHGLPDDAKVQGVAEALERMFPGDNRVAYQDEIFVNPTFQGLGVGRELFRLRHRRFMERGLVGYVLRTKRNPPARSYTWYGVRWGYETIGIFPDVDERVVLASGFENIRGKLARTAR